VWTVSQGMAWQDVERLERSAVASWSTRGVADAKGVVGQGRMQNQLGGDHLMTGNGKVFFSC
jgi:hypothetical protein